jgi:hypothetical protein
MKPQHQKNGKISLKNLGLKFMAAALAAGALTAAIGTESNLAPDTSASASTSSTAKVKTASLTASFKPTYYYTRQCTKPPGSGRCGQYCWVVPVFGPAPVGP